MAFKRITARGIDEAGRLLEKTDYIPEELVMRELLYQNSVGWAVTDVVDDDRPDTADRTFTPPPHLQ